MLITNKHAKTMNRLAARKGVTGIGRPTCTSRNPYTMVTVRYGNKTGVGFSKCSPKDFWNEGVGFNIALSRAIDDARSST